MLFQCQTRISDSVLRLLELSWVKQWRSFEGNTLDEWHSGGDSHANRSSDFLAGFLQDTIMSGVRGRRALSRELQVWHCCPGCPLASETKSSN